MNPKRHKLPILDNVILIFIINKDLAKIYILQRHHVMSTSNKVGILLEWCDTNFISIHSTIHVEEDEQGGISVFAANNLIPPNTTCASSSSLVLIPYFTPLMVVYTISGQNTPNLHSVCANVFFSWRCSL